MQRNLEGRMITKASCISKSNQFKTVKRERTEVTHSLRTCSKATNFFFNGAEIQNSSNCIPNLFVLSK